MWIRIIEGISIPFIGTVLGAACVLFMRPAAPDIGTGVRKKQALTGFAAGIMVAASFFSLLIPSIEYSDGMGKLSFVPAVTGFLVGMLFMLALDVLIPHIHSDKSEEGLRSGLSKTTKLVLAVTLHNIPLRSPVRRRRTCGRDSHDTGCRNTSSGAAVSAGLRSGSYALCRGRGTGA